MAIPTKLIESPGNRSSEIVCNALFNDLKVNAYRMCDRQVGDDFTYGIYTEEKLTNAKISAILYYLKGLETGLRASGLWS